MGQKSALLWSYSDNPLATLLQENVPSFFKLTVIKCLPAVIKLMITNKQLTVQIPQNADYLYCNKKKIIDLT